MASYFGPCYQEYELSKLENSNPSAVFKGEIYLVGEMDEKLFPHFFGLIDQIAEAYYYDTEAYVVIDVIHNAVYVNFMEKEVVDRWAHDTGESIQAVLGRFFDTEDEGHEWFPFSKSADNGIVFRTPGA